MKIVIHTPQFDRPQGSPEPQDCPEDMSSLTRMSAKELTELGLQPWNDPADPDTQYDPEIFHNNTLWLLPGEWHAKLPLDYEFTSINGNVVKGDDVSRDDDTRFGCLAYGILVPVQ